MNQYELNDIQKRERLGETNLNHEGCLMRIIKYNTIKDIIVEFVDEFNAQVHTQYSNFKKGNVRNPYYPNVYGVGMTGVKYLAKNHLKEWRAWQDMLRRCYSEKLINKRPTYQNVTCCEEWLLFENFYEWLFNQENYNKWLNGERWCVDKDILVKGNKIYSPETCCLVSNEVNCLFLKSDNSRNGLPIGVSKKEDKFQAYCDNPFTHKKEYLGLYSTPEQAFNVYKINKEKIIKQAAQEEYVQGNITKECYEAMLRYEVEITD